jgi:hypothetical protein
MSKFNAIMMGVCSAIFGAFPSVWLVAAVHRFPAPMGGVLHGTGDLGNVIVTVVIYGLLGGFPLLGVLGGLAGAMAHDMLYPDDGAITRRILLSVLGIDLVVTGVMSFR